MTFSKTTWMALVASSALALPVAADQQILDDLIVQGSACIGFDCNNGESFGFDTLRLKENNLRIHFDDTSNSASFPQNDWRIGANDTSNGGANKLFFEDATAGRQVVVLEAGAPANAIVLDNAGRLGLGTANPVVQLQVVDGNTPTLRLEQDGSSGFTPQVFDVAANEANFFVRDATNGSQLPFKIRPGADSNSLVIAANNNVGIGTDSPDGAMEVARSGVVLALATSTTNSAVQWRLKSDDGNRRMVAINSADAVETQIVLDNTEIHLAGSTSVGADLWARVSATGIELPAGAAFSVNGANLTVPDYVFGPEYELMPLADVATFIAENSHLPNVPSAAEINGSTLDMTAMQMTLLRKVEELTLYTLDQQQKIDALEAALATR